MTYQVHVDVCQVLRCGRRVFVSTETHDACTQQTTQTVQSGHITSIIAHLGQSKHFTETLKIYMYPKLCSLHQTLPLCAKHCRGLN